MPTVPDAPDTAADARGEGRPRWRLPSYIWQDPMRRYWLESAEQAFREGYEESVRVDLERSVILRLFFWRGIEVPVSVRRRLRETDDLAQLEAWRERAYHVAGPEDLFAAD
ncbi:hypothetical protein ACF09K_09630 [Streptomyces sp. NPDC014882]|uniref:hypothetical protein n=1 Tax=Streptomyces sp. NPDC014882 TaxID=3364927 RepID=UPI0036FA7F98